MVFFVQYSHQSRIRIKYDSLLEWDTITKEKNTNAGANRPKTRKLVGPRKKRGWKSHPKEVHFPVYLHFITERMRYFAYSRRISVYNAHAHTAVHIRANYARSTARPCLADHSHGYSTAASAVLPRRKVLNGEAGLKKGSGGANASASEGTSGVISRSAKKLYFMIAATFKPPTMRYVRSLARSLARLLAHNYSMHSKPRLRVPSSPFYRASRRVPLCVHQSYKLW